MTKPMATVVGIYAEELDNRLEQMAIAARREVGDGSDAAFRDRAWLAKGLEAAREILRQLLRDAVCSRCLRRLSVIGTAATPNARTAMSRKTSSAGCGGCAPLAARAPPANPTGAPNRQRSHARTSPAAPAERSHAMGALVASRWGVYDELISG